MANSAISSPDLAILRGNSATRNLTINITPYTAIQTGTITAVPAIDPYTSLTWDGTTTGIVVGQMVKITNGSTVRTWGIIRKAPSGSTLFINEVPLGSPGYSGDIESAIQVGDTVAVYPHHPLWGLHTRLSNRVFYTQWDVAYVSQLDNPAPQANAGQHQAAKVAVGETASFTLPRFGTNTSFPLAGTLSAYLWTLPTGVTLQAGYATSDAVIEVDAEPGYHLVSLRVTDSNGSTHTAYRWLFVSDGTDGQTLDERYAISNVTAKDTPKGLTGTFTITGTSLQDVLYPGALILINETPHFDSGTLTDGVFVDTFCAYIVEIDYTYSADRVASATVSFESPILYASRIVQPEQSLTEVTNPANWTQCTSALSNPRGAFWYACKYKTDALLDMHDYDANSLTTPRRKTIEFNTKTLGQAIELVGKMFDVNIGSAADGTTVMREMPLHMGNTARNALAVRMTWQAQDISLDGQLAYKYNLLSKVAETVGGAFAYNGSTVKAWYAGKKWNQGSSTATMPNFTVPFTSGLSTVLEKVGHFHAAQNRTIDEIPLTLLGNMDVIDPAYMIWDRLTIDAAYDPRGAGWSSARMLATRVDRAWNKTALGYEKSLSIGLQPETFGQPGKEIPIANVRTYIPTTNTVEFTPRADETFGSVGMALVCNETGDMAVTYNYLATSPQWIDLSAKFTGDVCDFDWDYNSDFFANGYALTSDLGVYVCTIDGTTFRVYRITDVKNAASTVELLTSATMADSSANYNGRIKCSETTPTYCIAVWKDQTGIEHIYTDDGGTTWSSKANIGNAVTDSDNDDAHIGLDVLGTTTLVTAPDSTPEYGLYIATTAGGAFSAVTSTQRHDKPQPLIKMIGATSAYVAKGEVASGEVTETVTFDAGGYANYTINAGTNSAPAEEAVGNPDDCLREEGTSGSDQTVDFSIDIDLGSVVPVTAIGFDAWWQANNSVFGTVNVEYKIEFYNGMSLLEDIEIWTLAAESSEWHNTGTIDLTGSEPTLPDPALFIHSSDWLSTSYPDGVECDRIRIDINNTNQVNSWDWRIDNIAITYGAPGIPPALYKVTSLTGTSSWTDVSPAANQAPVRPHDLAIDIIDPDIVNTVADDGNRYQSTDAASNWTTEESSTDKRVPYSVSPATAFAGVGEVVIGLDGTNFDDATGNLSASWTIGTIKRLLIL